MDRLDRLVTHNEIEMERLRAAVRALYDQEKVDALRAREAPTGSFDHDDALRDGQIRARRRRHLEERLAIHDRNLQVEEGVAARLAGARSLEMVGVDPEGIQDVLELYERSLEDHRLLVEEAKRLETSGLGPLETTASFNQIPPSPCSSRPRFNPSPNEVDPCND